ncbi:hypothetical protein K438DRAFT_2014509 [Mycena galopus ATCC 62051]|nr:hypothetical protein K438DRAFT_2014509 [Mycena galopus ATCC 62051]
MFCLQILALALASVIPQIAAIPTPALLTLPYPLFPQSSPAPAVIHGVDSQGHTTYFVADKEVGEDGGGPTSTVPFTATLVAGADSALYTFSVDGLSLQMNCDFDFQSGNALCPEVLVAGPLKGQTSTNTFPIASLAPSNFVLDVVSNLPAPNSNVVSMAPSGNTVSTAAPSAATTKSNSSPRLLASISCVVAGSMIVAYGLL